MKNIFVVLYETLVALVFTFVVWAIPTTTLSALVYFALTYTPVHVDFSAVCGYMFTIMGAVAVVRVAWTAPLAIGFARDFYGISGIDLQSWPLHKG